MEAFPMVNNLQLLKKNGISFFWNDADKHWWLRKIGANGKSLRTKPVKAENREDAEAAAVSRYVKGQKLP
jgi:hypothetical protein